MQFTNFVGIQQQSLTLVALYGKADLQYFREIKTDQQNIDIGCFMSRDISNTISNNLVLVASYTCHLYMTHAVIGLLFSVLY